MQIFHCYPSTKMNRYKNWKQNLGNPGWDRIGSDVIGIGDMRRRFTTLQSGHLLLIYKDI